MKPPRQLSPVIEPEGDRCVMLRFGSALDADVSRACLAAAAKIEQARLEGILDVVPSFTTVAVHYEPGRFSPSPHRTLAALLKKMVESVSLLEPLSSRTIKVPVCYDSDYAFDLAYVADTCGLTTKQVVDLHTNDQVRVFALGFAPGLPYIGVHDERLSIPRRSTPRTAVPAGSVAIANRQSVIYPNASPGGWHVIGATPVALFDPAKPPYTFLLPGDTVKFTAISRTEFETLKHAAS
jgi:inhibitor of KinA